MQPGNETRVQFSITFPARPAGSALRGRHYISPSIQSLSFSVNGAAPTFVNAPTPTGSPQTVTSTVAADPGSDTFAIAEFDAASGGGRLLGKVAEIDTVVLGQVNTIPITVDGELAKISIEPVPDPFLEGTLAAGFTLVGPQPQTFMAVPEDADGNTILSPGAVPALTVSSPSAAIVSAQTGGSDTFTLAAPAPTAAIAVTVSGENLENAAVKATLSVKALAAFYIADFTAQKVRAFDENGTPLALPSTTFNTLTNPMGLAYVPGTSGTPGSIVVTETSNYIAPYLLSFDLEGNSQTLAAGAFPGVSQPLFLSYGAGKLYVPNLYDSTLSVFTPAGTAATLAPGSFGKLASPVSATYDPDNGDVYVSNDGADTVAAYTAAGVLKATVATGSHPMGVAYDGNTKSIYVAYGGTGGDALDAPKVGQPQNAGVDEFTASLAPVSTTGGFVNASTAALFTGAAYDPYSKQVYVADAGQSKIDAFGETGTAITLAAGAFGSISPTAVPPSDPMAILFVP